MQGTHKQTAKNGGLMKHHIWSNTLRVRILLAIVTIFLTVPHGLSFSAEVQPRIQELVGAIKDGRGMVYTLSDFKRGDTLYAHLANTSGNLDPMLGVLKKDPDRDLLGKELAKVIENSDRNLIEALALFNEEHFMAWDDDSGNNHDAMLKFSIPADGTYFLFVTSTVTNQHIDKFEPHLTSGSYRLVLGLNTPSVAAGQGESTGDIIARIDNRYAKRSSHVQHLDQELTADKRHTFYTIRELEPDDSLSVRLVSTDNQPLPRLYLSDFAGKLLALGDDDRASSEVTLTYHSQEGAVGLVLSLDGNNVEYSQ